MEYDIQKLKSASTRQILPRGFVDAVLNRYLPVLSFTFLSTLTGIAFKMGGVTEFVIYFFRYKEAYLVATAVCIWVSAPAILWILLQFTEQTRRFADMFYVFMTLSMVLLLLTALFLFPHVHDYYTQMVRLFIAAAIPLHVIQYVFLVRGGLPFQYATVLNLIGACIFSYGFLILR